MAALTTCSSASAKSEGVRWRENRSCHGQGRSEGTSRGPEPGDPEVALSHQGGVCNSQACEAHSDGGTHASPQQACLQEPHLRGDYIFGS